MSLSSARRGPDPSPWPSAVSRLVAVDEAEFAGRYWGEHPLLSRAAHLPKAFDDLLTLDAVDELVSTRGLRTPFLRVAKNGETLADSAFTGGGGVGAGITDQVRDDRLLALFADGATLVLQGLHRTWPPLIDFVAELSEHLGHPVQANAYVTPRQSQGFDDHYDVHDVFVLQVAGQKHWRIRPPVHKWPTRDQPWTNYRAQVREAATQPPLLDVTLEPGDCLYLPRGFLHSATANDEVSAHITLGIHTWTNVHVAQALVDEVMQALIEREEDRAPLGLGIGVDESLELADEMERLRARIGEIVRDVELEAVAARLRRREQAAGRPGPISPLAQARRAETLRTEDSIRLRPFVRGRLVNSPAGVRLESRAGTLALSADQRPAIEALLGTGSARASDLGLDLARQLLTRGIAT